MTDMRLPQAEQHLHALLGDQYVEADWQPVLKVVMDAENEVEKALKGLDQLTKSIFGTKISQLSTSNEQPAQQPHSIPTLPTMPQLTEAENGLQEAVDDLKQRKQIIGTPLTLEEMLNPIEEREVGNSEYIGIGKLRGLCEKVERLSLKYGDSETCLDLSQSLRQFRIQLRRVETAKARQTSLNEWFSSRESH